MHNPHDATRLPPQHQTSPNEPKTPSLWRRPEPLPLAASDHTRQIEHIQCRNMGAAVGRLVVRNLIECKPAGVPALVSQPCSTEARRQAPFTGDLQWWSISIVFSYVSFL